MALLEPGVPTAMFGKLDAEFQLRGRIALTPLADAIKAEAKKRASNGSHLYGTKTPAFPGSGPARISSTLYRSIDRSVVTREAFGWFCQVGMVPNQYPSTYRSKKSSSQYARILELTGCRNGATYPFLYPAFYWGVTVQAEVIYTEMYGSGWTRLI